MLEMLVFLSRNEATLLLESNLFIFAPFKFMFACNIRRFEPHDFTFIASHRRGHVK